jgi:hypothetical protein
MSAISVIHAYVFHILCDRFRPVTQGDRTGTRLDLALPRE